MKNTDVKSNEILKELGNTMVSSMSTSALSIDK